MYNSKSKSKYCILLQCFHKCQLEYTLYVIKNQNPKFIVSHFVFLLYIYKQQQQHTVTVKMYELRTNYGRWVALGRWLAKSERWVAK